jgi:hypothetical protein
LPNWAKLEFKNLKLKHIYFILLLIGVASCIAEFQPKWNMATEETYTVHGILFADSVAKIYLGRTSIINKNENPDDSSQAEVTLSWNIESSEMVSNYSEKLTYIDSVFVGYHILQPGINYKLEITTIDGKHLRSNTTIPAEAQIKHTSLLFPAGFLDTRTIKGPILRIFLDFDPPKEQTSYFETYIYVKDTSSDIPSYNIIRGLNNDQIILSEDLPSNYLHSFLLSTEGNETDLVRLSFDSFARPFFSEFYPTLLNVSEDYFLYKKSLFDHMDSIYYEAYFEPDDLYLPDIFKNIPQIHSNIEGGVGIFAGVNRSERRTVCNLVGNTCE